LTLISDSRIWPAIAKNAKIDGLTHTKYIGAIDQGTTSTRFLVFDGAGKIVASAQKEHRQIYPQAGWVEHDAEEIWQRTREVIEQALAQSGVKAAELAGIGITNQRETTVVWERKTGKPLGNAIVWQDMRVAVDAARYAREVGNDFFRHRTGLPLSTYFSALKLRWILENIAGARRQAEAGERPAGGSGRTNVFQDGRGQKHLRHRLLPADEYRRAPSGVEARDADDGGLQVRKGAASLRARRQHRNWRSAGAVAA
jgi:hypothetical protein